MITVSFNYDPETNKVSDVKAVGADVESAPVKAKTTRTKKVKVTDKVVLTGGSLKLTQDALDLLQVNVGDKLCVRFDPQPVLVRPEIANEPKGGNLITKSLTIAARGKTGETLSKLGNEFSYHLKSDGYLQLLSDGVIEMPVDKPVEEIDLTLDDSEFLDDLEDGEEIDFTIELN